ncbi:MAG: hypothetical protein HQ568_11485 [Calditrichaeota bacterium]|nr:hypothetical protein [Calditrichota bacterium]
MSKKFWLIILLIILLILLAIYIKCSQPESIVGSVSRAKMETAAATGDSCLYLSVQNDTLNKLSQDSTKILSAVEFYTMPVLKYRRYWIAKSGGKLDSIISVMNLKYPRWTSMKVLVTSLDPPYQIQCEVTLELVEPDGSTTFLEEYIPLPGTQEEPILKTFIETAKTSMDTIYLNVCNNVENKLDYSSNTTITAVTDVNLIPPEISGQYRRHWEILIDPVGYGGDTPTRILDAMNLAYPDPPGPDWLSLKIIATSLDPPYQIEGPNPDGSEVKVEIEFVDPSREEISFNNWGELTETEIDERRSPD